MPLRSAAAAPPHLMAYLSVSSPTFLHGPSFLRYPRQRVLIWRSSAKMSAGWVSWCLWPSRACLWELCRRKDGCVSSGNGPESQRKQVTFIFFAAGMYHFYPIKALGFRRHSCTALREPLCLRKGLRCGFPASQGWGVPEAQYDCESLDNGSQRTAVVRTESTSKRKCARTGHLRNKKKSRSCHEVEHQENESSQKGRKPRRCSSSPRAWGRAASL